VGGGEELEDKMLVTIVMLVYVVTTAVAWVSLYKLSHLKMP
jgi:hypothetical protein